MSMVGVTLINATLRMEENSRPLTDWVESLSGYLMPLCAMYVASVENSN